MTDPSGPPPSLTRTTIVLLDLHRDPTWGDLREYVAALAHKDDAEPLGLDIRSDDYSGTVHLDALIERI